MKNKENLLLVALILSITLVAMVWYAFSSLDLKKSKNSVTTKQSYNLEKIKREKLNNRFLEIKQKLEEDCQESDQAKQYEQEFIEKGEAKMADGHVIEVNNSYIKVKFNSASYTWISKVNITPQTSLTKLNPGSENTPISLSEVTINSKVAIRTSGESITNEEITAEKVVKVN